MKPTLKNIIQSKPVFLFLLPVFFVWHGYVEFYDLIPVPKALLLAARYLVGAIILFSCCWLIFKNKGKAALYSFFLLCLYFFFGSFQDLINKEFPGAFITKYSFLLSILLLVFILLFIYIKRRKKPLARSIYYLNILLLLLLLADGVVLASKISNRKNILTAGSRITLQPCPGCAKPDIYFIVTDGYSGHIPLERFFNFDNSEFENQLKKRGFYIADSSFANYNYTIFSVGSTLNMDYLSTTRFYHGKRDLPIAFKSLRDSRLLGYLKKENYRILNYSIFDINGQPARVRRTLLNFEQSPLSTQTFLYRLKKDIGFHLFLKFKFLAPRADNSLLYNLLNNNKIDSLTRSAAAERSDKPRFIYSHLVMPHWPYYFDSLGNRIPDVKLTDDFKANRSAYVSYLKYSNKKIIELVDYIQQHSARPPIIIVLGDHGCREGLGTPSEQIFQPMNFNAVFLPGGNYSGFYKGVSSVNLFRILLNAEFNQRLNMLKDSATLIIEKW